MSGAKSDKEHRKSHRGRTTERRQTTGNGRLIAVTGSRVGCKYVMEDVTLLGRAGDCDVVVDNAECSRHHARICRVDTGFTVVDLGSRNGTIVNGQRIEGEHVLAFGDRLRIGPHDVFLFTPHDPVEEQLLHRQRLETLGRLTAGIAHDLNNMLGAVKASVALIRDLPPSERAGEEAEGCLEDIGTAASRAADLAGRLMSFARPSGSHTSANISEIVNEAVMLARRTFDRTTKIHADVEADIHVDGDATQLHQVLMNLLVNARDAVASDGQIWVSASAGTSTQMTISVRDDGCGMDLATQAQIFEPFYTTKRPGAGFGLGLATVADIVRAHGGELTVTSAVDEGSTFVMTLPVTARPLRVAAVPTLDDVTGIVGKEAGNLRVALVDDEVVMRRSLARVFRHAGFTVRTFETGEELLESISDAGSSLPDALVLDLDLPGITGEETLRRLRARGAMFPVVCISGHHNPSRQREVGAAGASAFLGKPFEPSELVAAVATAIQHASDDDDQTSPA